MKILRLLSLVFLGFWVGIQPLRAQNWDQITKALADASSRVGISASARVEGMKSGQSVAISGNYAVVGLPGEARDATGQTITNAGAALVFKLESGTWRPIRKLTPSGLNARNSDDAFGSAVSISGDYIAVGAPNNSFDNRGENQVFQSGAVFIFKKDEGGVDNWGQILRISPSGSNNRNISDGFGTSLAITNGFLFVGSPNNSYDATGGSFASRAGAVFVFRKDQGGTDNWGQIRKLVSNDRLSNDRFGACVAVSGEVAIVGAPGQSLDANGENSLEAAGAVYLFGQNSGGTNVWGQLVKTVASQRAASNAFGSSVAIDGSYAVVGAPFQQRDANNENPLAGAGAAYLLFKDQGSSNSWAQQAMLIPTGLNARLQNDEFGSSVAIAGAYAFVGSAKNDFNNAGATSLSNSGVAFVFKRDQGGANNWGQIRRIGTSQTRNADDLYGFALAATGNNLLVGAPGFRLNANNSFPVVNAGAAFFHTVNQGGTDAWGQAQALIPGSTAIQDNMGYSVAISGSYAAVGAPDDDENEAGVTIENSGSVYLFKRGGNQWNFLKKINPTQRGVNDAFGASVSLSGDLLAVGAPRRSPSSNLTSAGSVFLFRAGQGGTDNWGQIKLIVPTGTNAHLSGDEFGTSLSISGDLLMVGAPKHDFDANGSNQVSDFGAAFIFSKNQGGDDNWGLLKKVIPTSGGSRQAQDNFGASVNITGQYAIVGAPNVASNASGSTPVTGAGAAFIFKKDQNGINNWGQVKKIVAFGNENSRNINDGFGSSVSIDGTYAVVGAPRHSYDTNGENQLEETGAAYVFKINQGGTDNWGSLIKLIATGSNARTQGDKFGSSVALSGGYALVGAPEHNHDASGSNLLADAGAAFVFGASQGGNDNWGLVRKISASGTSNREAGDKFGFSVALSSGTAWIGSPFHAGAPKVVGSGAAFVYQGPVVSIWNGTQWINGAPTSTQDAILEADYNTELRTNISCRNLTVNSGITLSIHAQGSVVVASATSNQGSILNCKGGNFSTQTLLGNPVALPASEPSTPASNVTLEYLGKNQIQIKWTSGNGTGRLVVLREGTAVASNAVEDSRNYTANSDFSANGSDIQGGKVVYLGSANSVVVSNIGVANYAATVFEFNQNAGCGPNFASGATSSPVLSLDPDQNSLKVYPNPTSSIIFVEIQEPTWVQITSLQGEVLKTYSLQASSQIQLDGLAKGIYLLTSQNASQKTVQKIVLE
jgi:hypothetical protein